jgi:tRNA/rRNA methyltransferase
MAQTLLPTIILIRPQLVENIGTSARAMMNCNLSEMRIVNPRDPWPLVSPQKERIAAASSGADEVLNNAKLFDDTPQAIADLHVVYATTARPRDMIKEVVTPRVAIAEVMAHVKNGQKVGLMFGPERTGLTNEEIVYAHKIVQIPANPEFSSFNLAQCVLVLAYEWLMANSAAPDSVMDLGKTRPATREELFNLFDHLERDLEAGGFFTTPELKPTMVQNLRNALTRAELTEQEIRTWHGIVTALVNVHEHKARIRK